MIDSTKATDKFLTLKLQHLTTRLGFETGIVSRIKDKRYKIIALVSNIPILKLNAEFDLKDTLCKQVVTTKRTVSYSQISEVDDLKTHPAYRNLKLESYIGVPIFSHPNNVWGTLNLSSLRIKGRRFSDEEIKEVEDAAHQVQGYLTKMSLIEKWD